MAQVISFPDIIEGLRARGETVVSIAREAGVSRETIHRLATGEIKEPKYSTGAALVRASERIPRTESHMQRRVR